MALLIVLLRNRVVCVSRRNQLSSVLARSAQTEPDRMKRYEVVW